jgi:hypothetical protein
MVPDTLLMHRDGFPYEGEDETFGRHSHCCNPSGKLDVRHLYTLA